MISSVLILLARIMLAAVFLSSGHSAVTKIEETASYFIGLGLGSATALAWVVGIFELLGGVLLVTGFQTRRAAALLALFTLAATYVGHYGQGGSDPAAIFMHSQMLLKDVAIAGGLVLLAILGAGRFSVDAAWGAR